MAMAGLYVPKIGIHYTKSQRDIKAWVGISGAISGRCGEFDTTRGRVRRMTSLPKSEWDTKYQ